MLRRAMTILLALLFALTLVAFSVKSGSGTSKEVFAEGRTRPHYAPLSRAPDLF